MTGIQAFAMGTAALEDLDPYRFPAARLDDRPEQTPTTAFGFTEPGDYTLPAPHPASRRSVPLEPADRRRLELHAALTTAGIAPWPGDLNAITVLCQLDDTTHAVLLRWINRAM